MRLNKNIKIFINYFFGPLLFIWLSYSIYKQVQNQSHLGASWLHVQQSFQSSKLIYLLLTFLLMLINWGLEARKWMISVEQVNKINFLQSFKAVLSGVSFSVTTPNRIGEYLGRMMYMPEGKRLKVIAVALIASYSQVLITLIIGSIGFIYLKDDLIGGQIISPLWYQIVATGLVGLTSILTILYFNISPIEKWLEVLLRGSSYLYLIESARSFNMQRLLRLLLLSLARYAVFMIQYILLFRLFEIDVTVTNLVGSMSVVFLALAIIPTIALVEIGLRGEISLHLLGLFTTNSLSILLTTVTAWFINLIVPALIGSILILSIKVFKRRYEKV